MVCAFGVTYPKADAERLPMGAIGSDLLYAVAEARGRGDTPTLEALAELLEAYERRMGGLLPALRTAMQSSQQVDLLLEARAQAAGRCCSPKYVDDALLEFAGVTLAEPSFHATRSLLEERLGMLRLRAVSAAEGEKAAARALQEQQPAEGAGAESTEAVGSESEDGSEHDDDDDDVYSTRDEEADSLACDEATWEVLQHLLGFQHTFQPSHCPRLLYVALAPDLLDSAAKADGTSHGSREHRHDEMAPSSTAQQVRPFLEKLARGAIASNGLDFASAVWPLVAKTGGIWLGSDFVPLSRCIWKGDARVAVVWEALQRIGCNSGPVVALEPALLDLFGLAGPEQQGERAMYELVSAVGVCCLKGAVERQGANGSSPPLPYPTDLEMLLGNVLPWLLGCDLDRHRSSTAVGDGDVSWSDETLSCYKTVLRCVGSGGPPRGTRWELPVPTATLDVAKIVVGRGVFSRMLPKDAAALLVLPDTSRWPLATAFVLRHFGDCCLHPSLAPLFAPLFAPLAAKRSDSNSFETARDRIQRTLKRCLRLAAADADGAVGVGAPPEADERPEVDERRSVAVGSGEHGMDAVWDLLSEVYERPLDESSTSASLASNSASASSTLPSAAGAIPPCFSASDNWEVLLWAAIRCASDWHLMQSTASPQAASRYQETLRRVRRLVPFVEVLPDGGGERWTFLGLRGRGAAAEGAATAEGATAAEGAAAASGEAPFDERTASALMVEASQAAVAPPPSDAPPTAAASSPAVLLLRTLFGFELWGGGLEGIELRDRAPTGTAAVPARVLSACAPSQGDPRLGACACFPEGFEHGTLTLMYEWFLVEVVGAAPPAVLWATVQEPISVMARPRIRAAASALWQAHGGGSRGSGSRGSGSRDGGCGDGGSGDGESLVASLLSSLETHTQASRLLDEMDAADEARHQAALREAEARRLLAEARRQEEQEARQQQRAAREAARGAVRDQQQRSREAAAQHDVGRRGRAELDRHAADTEDERLAAAAAVAAALDADAPEERSGDAFRQQLRQRLRQQRQRRHELNEARQDAATAANSADMDGMMREMQAAGDEADRALADIEATAAIAAAAAAGSASAEAWLHFSLEDFGVSNALRRTLGAAAGGAPVRRVAPTMRESEVKGKLARFLAGMRALERQQQVAKAAVLSSGGGGGGGLGRGEGGGSSAGVQPLPPMLSEFIVWAGDVLTGAAREQAGRGDASAGLGSDRAGGGGGGGGRSEDRAASIEAAARSYVGGGGRVGGSGVRGSEFSRGGASSSAPSAAADASSSLAGAAAKEEEEEICSICQDGLADSAVCDQLGESLETACGHRFHACCYARYMETSETDPVCPMCRSGNMSVRFYNMGGSSRLTGGNR